MKFQNENEDNEKLNFTFIENNYDYLTKISHHYINCPDWQSKYLFVLMIQKLQMVDGN